VTLSANEPATIYYTTNGTAPTTSSTVYSGALSITSTTTPRYFAVDSTGNSEAVQSQVYTIVDVTAPVTTASPSGGTYTGTVSVTLSASEPATIYYTTNGTAPTTSSAVYSGALSIASTTTLQFFAVDSAGNNEVVQSQVYTIMDTTAPVTTASPAGGTYFNPVDVTLSANEPATIYYTTNGSTPTTSSTVYAGPISMAVTTTLQFFAVDSAGNSESVKSAVYSIQAPPVGSSIVHQSSSGQYQDYGSGPGSITWNHTVGAGSDRLLIVSTAIDSNNGAVVRQVSFDGNLLTRKQVKNQGWEQEVQLWYMLDPPVGTYPVTVSYSQTNYGIEARASSYTGVSPNKPISTAVVAGGSGTAAAVTIASAPGELVIDALAYRSGGTMSANASQTERFNQSASWNGTAGSDKAGASSVTMSWSLQYGATWSMAAASLRPAQSPIVRTVTVKPSGGDYTSLNAALAGEAADLVALNRQLNIELYAMTDTTAVDLATPAYVTDADHFIKVYTPASQRPSGVWDPGKYNLDAVADIAAGGGAYPACFNIGEVDLWLDGIQAMCSYSGTDYPSMIAADPGPTGTATLRVSNSLFKGNWIGSNSATNANFMMTYDWPATSEMWVWNTIATDFWWADHSRGRGLHTFGTQGGEIWWSNVTVANLANVTAVSSNTQLHVRNSLAYLPSGGTSWPTNAWAIQPDSDYNASNQNETLVGAHSVANRSFTFRGTDDWRLHASDTGAKDMGVNSYNSYNVNAGKDITGTDRNAVWDIGASE